MSNTIEESKWTVTFNDGSTKEFTGFWKNILKDISDYCDEKGLETTDVIREGAKGKKGCSMIEDTNTLYGFTVMTYFDTETDDSYEHFYYYVKIKAPNEEAARNSAMSFLDDYLEKNRRFDAHVSGATVIGDYDVDVAPGFTLQAPDCTDSNPPVYKNIWMESHVITEEYESAVDPRTTPMERFSLINDLIYTRIDDYYEGTYSAESLVTLIRSRLPLVEKIKQEADIETRIYINEVMKEWTDILADLEPVIVQDGSDIDDYDDLDDEPEIMPSDMDDDDYEDYPMTLDGEDYL